MAYAIDYPEKKLCKDCDHFTLDRRCKRFVDEILGLPLEVNHVRYSGDCGPEGRLFEAVQ